MGEVRWYENRRKTRLKLPTREKFQKVYPVKIHEANVTR
jgi:hypothetical protein